MTTLQTLREVVSPALVRGVGYALLHSLWQGGALALLLAGALPLLRRHRAEVRYAVAAGALATLVLAVGLTFGYYYQTAPTPTEQLMSGLTPREQVVVAHLAAFQHDQPASPVALLPALARQVEPYLPLLVATWLLGLLVMGGRFAGGLWVASQLRRVGVQAVGADWQRRLATLATRAGLRQPVALLESVRVRGPLVVGHLRPVILLPLGALAGLPPALLEALLAHELAHIVRRDYLLNLAISVVEVLFFYHPAVWFMANCLRAERENCCDDQAATLCGGDRLRVARALAALAELEAAMPVPQLALAAAGAGGRGSLLARVRRLALGRPQAPTLGEGLLAMLLGVAGVAGLSTGVALAAPAGSKVTKTLLTNVKQAVAPADTTRKPKVASATPAVADTVRHQVRVMVDTDTNTEVEAAPRVRTYTFSQQSPPRRERASTVVIEKDKKGRVVNLTVDGQPVETDAKGKKSRRDKKEKVRTVEVVRVPNQVQIERLERVERPEKHERPERPERLEKQNFSFNFSTDGFGDAARQSARRGLTDALRNPDLTSEQRQAMKDALKSLGDDKVFKSFQGPNGQQFKLNFNANGFATLDKNAQRQRSRYDIRNRTVDGLFYTDQAEADLAAAQADREAARADREAARADREAELADHEGERAELAARRAELRARIAAAAAELRALESRSAPRPPRAPRAPRAPLAPTPPMPPMGPMVPAPPAPPTPPEAPNTGKLRDALRKDGLIKDEKHFSFQLNDQGGSVNGRALTPAQVAKYRELLKQPASKSKNTKTNISISVDEN